MSSTYTTGIDFNQVNNYVSARAGEIIANINEQIKYAGLTADKLPAGIVLVGRGSKLTGFDQRLGNQTSMKVRFGAPVNRLRILDGRVNGTDHVDVISILAAAAKERNVRECMGRVTPEYAYTAPTQPTQAPQPQQQVYQQPAYQPQTPQPAPVQQTSAYQQPQQQQTAAAYQPQQAAAETAYQQPAANPYQPQTPAQPAPQSQTQQSGYQQRPTNPYGEQARNITVQTERAYGRTCCRTPRKPSSISRAWSALRERMVSLMTEPVEDDEPDNDDR